LAAIVSFSNYTVVPAYQVNTLPLDCPTLNDQTMAITVNKSTATSTQNFRLQCNFDYPAGLPALNGGTVADLMGIIAYSLEDCLSACVYLNWQGTAPQCQSVFFGAALGYWVKQESANCWLKNSVPANDTFGYDPTLLSIFATLTPDSTPAPAQIMPQPYYR
jgi:hypothetical protein